MVHHIPTQAQKAETFRALHAPPSCFLMPNPWDLGSARLLQHAGFKALATTSAGLAFSKGHLDNTLTRDTVIAHLAQLAGGTEVPISADLENGFGHSPREVELCILEAAAAGVVGGSIEDAWCRPSGSHCATAQYPIDAAAERIRAAAEAANSLPFPFMLTARAENFVVGNPDLKDTIRRLQAYQEAGAHVLFAPGLTCLTDIATVVREIDLPLNVLIGLERPPLNQAALAKAGVRRISVGGSLARVALKALSEAAEELQKHGTWAFTQKSITSAELAPIFAAPPSTAHRRRAVRCR